MLPEVWKMVFDSYQKLGYLRPSLMIEDCVMDAFRNKFSGKLSDDVEARVKKFQKVKRASSEVAEIIFTSGAGRIYDNSKKDLDSQVKQGLMLREHADFLLKELKKKLIESNVASLIEFKRRKKVALKAAFLKKHGHKHGYVVTKDGKIGKA